MNSIKKNIFKVGILLITYMMIINPVTLAYFDENPPLSTIMISIIILSWLAFLLYVLAFYYFRQIFIQISVAICFLLSLELVARLVVIEDPKVAFKMARPEPYQNAKYFSKDFVLESKNQPGGYFVDKTSNTVKPNNFEGKWINVKNNRRVTVNKEGPKQRKLYIFGGSTVYNAEVPDDMTIASQLARLISAEEGIEVVNMGVSSLHVGQQLAKLKNEIDLKENDIVVFYDGVNDVGNRIVYGNSEGYMQGEPTALPLHMKILSRVSVISTLALFIERQFLKNTRDYPANILQEATTEYVNDIETAHRYVSNKKAIFFHFLQPTLYTKINLNEYEESLLDNNHLSPIQFKVANQLAYPLMIESLQKYEYSKSLVNLFNDTKESVFLDFCHVNHIGNLIIAKAILESLERNLGLVRAF